ncbi:MAG TPA: hypothetical protein VMV44_10840 [Rectinemataceae bacterium]|nr:hypothetical protein [Rectinemataceae bacterium]
MACTICGAEADLILVRRGPNGASDESLCGRCARERGLKTRGGSIEIAFEKLLGNKSTPSSSVSCPVCGMKEETLRKSRRIGCSACVDAFRDELRLLLLSKKRARASRAKDPSVGGHPYGSENEGCPASLPAILRSHVRVERMFPGLPLPGMKAVRHPASSAAGALLARAGYAVSSLEDLDGAGLSSLSQQAMPSSSWIEDRDSIVGVKEGRGIFCLVDSGDHLSFRISRAGSDLVGIEAQMRSEIDAIDVLSEPARDPEFGILCASIEMMGEAKHADVLLHLPALTKSGGLDRILKAVMAEGWSLEGRYDAEADFGAGASSNAALWSLSGAPEREWSTEGLAYVAGRIAEVEESARKDLAIHAMLDLLDAASRAFGLISYAWSLSLGESLTALSDLRLAALSGLVPHLEAQTLGELLAAIASEGGASPRTEGGGQDRAPGRSRARWLRSVFGLDEPFAMPGPFLKIEGGS